MPKSICWQDPRTLRSSKPRGALLHPEVPLEEGLLLAAPGAGGRLMFGGWACQHRALDLGQTALAIRALLTFGDTPHTNQGTPRANSKLESGACAPRLSTRLNRHRFRSVQRSGPYSYGQRELSSAFPRNGAHSDVTFSRDAVACPSADRLPCVVPAQQNNTQRCLQQIPRADNRRSCSRGGQWDTLASLNKALFPHLLRAGPCLRGTLRLGMFAREA